jgi:Fe-S-cluster-containing hydrogenase component 2
MPAVVKKEVCIGCQACVGVCPVEAIAMNDDKALVDAEKCIDCGACVGECPVEAIEL